MSLFSDFSCLAVLLSSLNYCFVPFPFSHLLYRLSIHEVPLPSGYVDHQSSLVFKYHQYAIFFSTSDMELRVFFLFVFLVLFCFFFLESGPWQNLFPEWRYSDNSQKVALMIQTRLSVLFRTQYFINLPLSFYFLSVLMVLTAINFDMSNLYSYILKSIVFQIYFIRMNLQKWNYYVKVKNLFMGLGV